MPYEPSSAESMARADARMTADRNEIKFLVPSSITANLAKELAGHLAPHGFWDGSSNLLPDAHHFVTTVYFDTPDRAIFAEATSKEQCVKVRAKEYYDLHPSLSAPGTDLSKLVRYSPVLWLELKAKHGRRTGKRRIGIPKSEVPLFFSRGTITRAMLEIQQDLYGSEGRMVLDELACLCGRFDQSLEVSALVNYRRAAWQDRAGELRVTIDRDLGFFRQPPDIWSRCSALVRESLGEPTAVFDGCVLEVKAHDNVPAWLDACLHEYGIVPVEFSKFVAASTALGVE